jgi:hypothetical protein
MANTVRSCAHIHTSDIDVSEDKSAKKWEALATVCVTKARDALKAPTGSYTKVHRDTMSDLLRSMIATQGSIRKLLEGGDECAETIRPAARIDSPFLLPKGGRCLTKSATTVADPRRARWYGRSAQEPVWICCGRFGSGIEGA